MGAAGEVETCHRRCQTGIRGASGVEVVPLAGGTGGRARGCETRYGAVPFRHGRDAVNERLRRGAGPTLIMQAEFECCLGLGRPSRSVKESRKQLAGAYSNRDKGQARTAADRARVARLKRWSARLRSAQARTVSSAGWIEYVHAVGTLGTYLLHTHSQKSRLAGCCCATLPTLCSS